MNQTLKIAIGATIGGAVGYFAASVAVAYIHMMEDEKNRPYDQSDEMPDNEEEEENQDNQRPVEMSKNQKTRKTIRTDYSAYFTPEEKVDLDKLAAKYNRGELPEEETEDETEVDETPELIDVGDDAAITIITMAEFANSQYGYEQVTLSYYDDDVVTDEEDNPIANPEKFLGEEALVSFGQSSNDENVVYVRNHEKKTEYEILHARCSYAPAVSVDRSRRPSRGLAKESDEGEED